MLEAIAEVWVLIEAGIMSPEEAARILARMEDAR